LVRSLLASFLLLVAFSATARPAFAQADVTLRDRSQRWKCQAEQKWLCEPPDGCKRVDASRVWLTLDFRSNTYHRCDSQGCDEYRMTATQRGIFTYAELVGHPDTFLKIGLGDSYVEAVSEGVSVFNTFGTCTPQKSSE
jgi:hypothetical protein